MKNTLFYGNFRPALTSKLVIPALFALAVSCAHGALTQTVQVNASAAPSPFLPLDLDLLETSVATFSGENPACRVRNGSFSGAHDGNTVGGDFPAQVWGQVTTTYDFDLITNPLGYDITLIQAYSAWGDRASQSYRIFYAQVGSPLSFLQLGADINAPTGAASVITRAVDSVPGTSILSGVSSIQFVQFDGTALNDGIQTVYRELDVVGFATIPEPTTSVLGLGAAILLLYRRRS